MTNKEYPSKTNQESMRTSVENQHSALSLKAFDNEIMGKMWYLKRSRYFQEKTLGFVMDLRPHTHTQNKHTNKI